MKIQNLVLDFHPFQCSYEHIQTVVNLSELRDSLRKKFPAAHRHVPLPEQGETRSEEKTTLSFDPGTINEVVSKASSQGMSLLISRLLAEERDLPLALIDGRDSFDPASHGNDRCGRLLWIRCSGTDQIIQATDLLLRDGNLPLVLLDLHLVPARELSRIPNSLWHRFRTEARESGMRPRRPLATHHRDLRPHPPLHRGCLHPRSPREIHPHPPHPPGHCQPHDTHFLKMFAALHFPDLPLHCLLASGEISPGLPTALLSDGELEKARILALNPAAAARGITHGMGSLPAMARCADLYFLNRDPETEKAAADELLTFAESLTPDFESTTTETVILDLSTLLIASPQDWTHRTLEKASRLQLPAHLAISETPDFAHLCSLSPLTSATLLPPATIHIPREPSSPLPLTIAALTRSAAFPVLRSGAEILSLWGIRTLGDLAALPRQGLSERLGSQLTHLHDILHGKQHRLLKLLRPPTGYAARHDFESPLTHFEPILFIARRLLQTLCNRLRNTQRAATAIRIILRYEDRSSHRKHLALTETTLDPEILLRSLHTHLDTLRAPAPVTGFSLILIPALPSHKQHEIFRKGLRDPHRFADTLHRLSALVGHDRLGIPRIKDSHHPDSFTMHPVTPDFSLPPAPEIPPSGNLPLSRLRPPVTVTVMSEKRGKIDHPLAILTGPHRGTIRKTAGPYPLSGNWWDRTWQQTQWDIQLPQNHLLQLTHTPPDTWQITGTYNLAPNQALP